MILYLVSGFYCKYIGAWVGIWDKIYSSWLLWNIDSNIKTKLQLRQSCCVSVCVCGPAGTDRRVFWGRSVTKQYWLDAPPGGTRDLQRLGQLKDKSEERAKDKKRTQYQCKRPNPCQAIKGTLLFQTNKGKPGQGTLAGLKAHVKCQARSRLGWE